MNAIKAILLALLGAWLLLGTRFAANHHLTAEELERDAERALAFERREWTAVEGEARREWSAVEGEVRRDWRRVEEEVGREARLGAEAAQRVLESFHETPPPPPPAPTQLTRDRWISPGRAPVIEDMAGPFVKANDVLHGSVTATWTPPVTVKAEPGCDWRQCFDERKKAKCLHFCREGPRSSEDAPAGYVPDAGAVRRRWLAARPPPLPKELCEDFTVQGANGQDTNKRLLEEAPIKAQPFVERSGPRVLCLMYTTSESHATHVRAAVETWAPGCDGFVAFSTESDPSLNAVKIEHQGPEAYTNMWQKLRSIWTFVNEHYADDYDFFFAGGEDLYVLPQNLRDFLKTRQEGDVPQMLGRRFRDYGRNLFNSGGAGYALSRGALRAFVKHKNDRACAPQLQTPTEDVQIAKCLSLIGVVAEDTRDAQGKERFHPFAPGHHLTIKPPQKGQPRDWFYDYTAEWPPLPGAECCSAGSVSFHYLKKPAMVRHIQAALYECGN